MKSEIKNFKWLFQIKDDGGIGGECTAERMYSLLPCIKNDEIANPLCNLFGFRKGKTGNLSHQLRAIYFLLIN